MIGGVETILYEQATRLSARGYAVTVLAGRGGPLPNAGRIELVIIPELDSRLPRVTSVRDQLMQGTIPTGFVELQTDIHRRLQAHLGDIDVLIVHNALSLHFNLALTAALWKFADSGPPRIISWMHDLSWVNPLYRPWMHEGEPWNLLRRQHPRITPVFVSNQRMNEWRALSGAPVSERDVIPNGVDPAALLGVGPRARALVTRFNLLETDVLLLAPVRISKRKNLEWAIEAAAAVRDSGRRVQLLITGPPGPHNPRSLDYVAELKQLTHERRLDEAVHFLFELGAAGSSADDYPVDASTLSDLYLLSDLVVLPSASEGFGLPLAEAAILRVPVVGTDLPAFREVAPQGAILVPLEGGSTAFSAAVQRALEQPVARLRRHVLNALSWDRLISERIEPLLS